MEEIKDKVIAFLESVFIPINKTLKGWAKRLAKWNRTRIYNNRREYIEAAKGELVEQFEPLINRIFEETVRDFEEAIVPRTHYHNDAIRDFRRLFEIKIKSFINSKR